MNIEIEKNDKPRFRNNRGRREALMLNDCWQDHQFGVIEAEQLVKTLLDPRRVGDYERRLVENGFPGRLQVRPIFDDLEIRIAPEVDNIRALEASRDALADQAFDGEFVQVERVDRNVAALDILEDPIGHAIETGGQEQSFGRRPIGDRLAVGPEIDPDDA